MQKQNCAVGGSGGTFIKGYAVENYRPDMTRDEAREFIQNAIALACYNDGSSGGCIRMITITEAAIQREFIPYTDFKKK
jgi:20S proteasome subunit beta 1